MDFAYIRAKRAMKTTQWWSNCLNTPPDAATATVGTTAAVTAHLAQRNTARKLKTELVMKG